MTDAPDDVDPETLASEWEDVLDELNAKLERFAEGVSELHRAVDELFELHQLVVLCSELPRMPAEATFLASNAERVSEARRFAQQGVDQVRSAGPLMAALM